MSYSIYIPCKSEQQKNELLSFIKENFEFPDPEYPEYIGTDLCYVNDEFENCHVGFELHGTGYLTKLIIICLSHLARKNSLSVYWDFDSLEIENYKDEDLESIEKFIGRNLTKRNENDMNWKQFRSRLLYEFGLFLETRSIRKAILKKCNEVIQTFKKYEPASIN